MKIAELDDREKYKIPVLKKKKQKKTKKKIKTVFSFAGTLKTDT